MLTTPNPDSAVDKTTKLTTTQHTLFVIYRHLVWQPTSLLSATSGHPDFLPGPLFVDANYAFYQIHASQTVDTQQTRTQLASSLISSAWAPDLAVALPSSTTLKSETHTAALASSSVSDLSFTSLESSQVPSDSSVLLATVPLVETTFTVAESTESDIEPELTTTLVLEDPLVSSSLFVTTAGTVIEPPRHNESSYTTDVAPTLDSDGIVTPLPPAMPTSEPSVDIDTEVPITPAAVDIDEIITTRKSDEPQISSERPKFTSVAVETLDSAQASSPSSEISATETISPAVGKPDVTPVSIAPDTSVAPVTSVIPGASVTPDTSVALGIASDTSVAPAPVV
nr:mucin-17-like [Penaeus vannamei]